MAREKLCLDGEEWRDIIGYEGYYQVSNLGRVRSVDRSVPHINGTRLVRGGVIKLKDRTKKSPVANLNKDDVRIPHFVDILVAKAFIGDAPSDDMVLAHVNGDARDCSAANLRWEVDVDAVLPDEEWRAAAGYEGLYEVSNLGRVRSVGRIGTRVDGSRFPVDGSLITQRQGKFGHYSVILSDGTNRGYERVDFLVANTFICKHDDDYFVDHINGDAGDSHVGNLRWIHKDDYSKVILGIQDSDDQPEEWRDIEGYEGCYQVSSLGRVKSLHRASTQSDGTLRTHSETILKPSITQTRCAIVMLRSDGKPKPFMVHRLVAKAFLDNPDNLEQVDHINSIRTDNRASNLRWCSRRENMRHCTEFRGMKRLADDEPHDEQTLDEIDGEEWRDIPDTDGIYQVSNLGRVRSKDRLVNAARGSKRMCRGRILRARRSKNGYMQVNIPTGNRYVHRLVAEAFIDNLDDLPVVNHINGNKDDNRVDNLRWCTHEQSIQHAIENGLFNPKESSRRMWEGEAGARLTIRMREIHGKPVRRSDGVVFESIRVAAEDLGVDESCISSVLSGKSRTCKGYRFDYANESDRSRERHARNRRKVAQIDIDTGEVLRVYDNVHEAISAMDNTGIPNCLRGSSHTCAGFKWAYAS